MNPLSLIPGWVKLAILVALAAAALLLFARWKESIREEGRQEVRAEWALDREAQKDAAIRQAAANAAETARRLKQQQEAQHAHQVQLAAVRRDAARADAAARGLRQQLTEFAAAARGAAGDSAPAGAGEATRIQLLADMLGDVEQAGRAMAAEADAARAAGQLCTAAYEALTPQP